MNLLLGLPLRIFQMLGTILMSVLRFAPVVLVLVVGGILLFRHRRASRQSREAEEPAAHKPHRSPKFTGKVVTVDYKEVKEEDICAQPTAPAPFGYKPEWIVLRAKNAKVVCEALGLQDCRPANWTCGLSAVSGRKWFVTPSLDGYVVAVGAGERPLSPALLKTLSTQFSEVQTYVCDQQKALYGWSLYRTGQCVRAYGMSRGQVLLDEGELTREEIALGFGRFPRKNGGSREGFPDGDAVLAIAAAWGVDPMLEQHSYPPSVGWLGTAQ